MLHFVFRRFKKIQSSDEHLNRIQDNVAEALHALPRIPILNGILHSNVSIAGRGTDLTSWSPSFSASGLMTYTSVSVGIAEYEINGQSVSLNLDFSGTTGGTPSNTVQLTLPTSDVLVSNGTVSGSVNVTDGSAVAGYAYVDAASPGVLFFRKLDNSNFGLGASRRVVAQVSYEIVDSIPWTVLNHKLNRKFTGYAISSKDAKGTLWNNPLQGKNEELYIELKASKTMNASLWVF